MAAVKDHSDVRGLETKLAKPLLNLVIHDVAVGIGATAAVMGDQCLVETIGFITIRRGDLGAMSGVADDDYVVLSHALGQILESS